MSGYEGHNSGKKGVKIFWYVCLRLPNLDTLTTPLRPLISRAKAVEARHITPLSCRRQRSIRGRLVFEGYEGKAII